MIPREIARRAWESNCTASFDRAEMLCLLHGTVISTTQLYIMAAFFPLNTPHHILTSISRQHRHMTSTGPLCHVWLASGKLPELLALLADFPCISHISYQKRGYEIINLPIHRLHGKRTKTTSKNAPAGGIDKH
jgi:hypothetical protein